MKDLTTYARQFDFLAVGILLLGYDGQVLTFNKRALQLMKNGHFSILGNRVILENDIKTQQLNSTIDNMNKSDISMSSPSMSDQCAMAIRCCEAQRKGCIELLLVPYVSGYTGKSDLSKTVGALILVKHIEQSTRPSAKILNDLYQLTPTEVDICQAMLEQMNTREIAERLSITQNSVRFHYKNMFKKMDIRRQSELIQVVAGGVAGLSRER